MNSEEHIKRISKVLHFVENNLDANLSLENLSKEGAYSPFHFHRIFKFITGETPGNYVLRKKSEKSAFHLALKKQKTIKEIYLELGFNNHSVFTKTFKKFYGISPSEFRQNAPNQFSRIVKINSNNGQKNVIFSQYICNIVELKNWSEMNLEIKIKELPQMHLAAVMSIGVQNVENSYNKLLNWAVRKKLFPRENVKMISVYHDSFKVTSPDKVRIHAAMLLDEPIKNEDEVFPEILPKGQYIVGRSEVTLKDFEKAWTSLFLWMNEHGYTMKKVFPFEIYHNNYKEHPEGKMMVDFCIPIN